MSEVKIHISGAGVPIDPRHADAMMAAPLHHLHRFEAVTYGVDANHRIVAFQIILSRAGVGFRDWAHAEETWRVFHRLEPRSQGEFFDKLEAAEFIGKDVFDWIHGRRIAELNR